MKRLLDCMIDQKVDGICILANYSEQFLLSDDEREILTKLCIEHVAGKVPIIVTVSHFSTDIAFKRAKLAKDVGANMVMMMPPYHGALLKGNANQTFEQFRKVSEAGITIMVQDAPLSGVDLSVDLLVKMAKEIEHVKCFKIECAQAANKLKALIDKGGSAIEGPFDGEEGITLFADLEASKSANNVIPSSPSNGPSIALPPLSIKALSLFAACAHSILKHLTCSISFAIFTRRSTERSTPDKGAS